MPAYPADRFDRPPADLARVGAHRAPRPGGRGWIVFAWAALATGVLVGIGVLAMFVINNRVSFDNPPGAPEPSSSSPTATATPTPTPPPPPQPTLDPAAEVVVLNGTGTDGLATAASDRLAAAGWNTGEPGNADTQDVAESTVYYGDPGQEGAARGVAEALGGIAVKQSTEYSSAASPNRITVVLGADYSSGG